MKGNQIEYQRANISIKNGTLLIEIDAELNEDTHENVILTKMDNKITIQGVKLRVEYFEPVYADDDYILGNKYIGIIKQEYLESKAITIGGFFNMKAKRIKIIKPGYVEYIIGYGLKRYETTNYILIS